MPAGIPPTGRRMSLVHTTDSAVLAGRAAGAEYIQARAAAWLPFMVAAWIFSGGIILFEPSLYEFFFVPVFGLAILAGLRLYRSTLPLLVLTLVMVPFSLIAAFQVVNIEMSQAFIFAIVTVFLLLTTYFAANYVAVDTHRRMRTIIIAYAAIAVLSSIIGVLGYLHLIPGGELFLRYGRVKAMFKDPNVFGPFLILPAIFALQKVLLTRNLKRMVTGSAVFLIVFLGVFASFSRAAWGNFAASALLCFLLVFLLEAGIRDKVRLILLGLAGGALLIVALAGIISTPAFNALFETRASVTQDYDTGETGRLGRQGYAFDLALQHPWGLGPMEFGTLEISEAPHNSYVTVIHHYGWGGGLAFYLLIGLTLWRGIWGLRFKATRLLLIPLLSAYVPLVVEAAIIDIDHWRHFFLIIGLIWGVTTFNAADRPRPEREAALI